MRLMENDKRVGGDSPNQTRVKMLSISLLLASRGMREDALRWRKLANRDSASLAREMAAASSGKVTFTVVDAEEEQPS